MKTYIVGDIHGEYQKFLKCLQSVNFDYDNDTLIQLGDVVDRGPDSFLVVEELLKIKNLIAIKGNHDDCFYQSVVSGNNNLLFNQGGCETLQSYIKHCNPDREIAFKMSGYVTDFDLDDYPISHVNFFKNQLLYYVDKDNNCFVHGGFNRHYLIDQQHEQSIYYWDRDLLHSARSYASMKDNEYPFKMKNNFKEVFIGHTPVQYFNETTPQKYANIWLLDTGAGKSSEGTVTIMDLETKKYKQF